MKVALVLLGFPAAVAVGTLALLTVGEGAAAVVFAVLLSVVVGGFFVRSRRVTAWILAALVIAGAVAGIVVVRGVVDLAAALSVTAGPTDPADPVELAAAEEKVEASSEATSFRVRLSESEVNALLQDALSTGAHPFRALTIDIRNAVVDPPLIDFIGTLKSGAETVTGTLTAPEPASTEFVLSSLSAGRFRLPGLARDAVEQMLTEVADLETSLAENGATVQQILIGDDAVDVSGVNPQGAPLDVSAIAISITEAAAVPVPVVVVDERIRQGRVAESSVIGPANYLVIGDSLAAGVGVEDHRDGFASQVHRLLDDTDPATLGYHNLGRSGETSRSLVEDGQLDEAIGFGLRHEVSLISVVIGANDLLGHLTSPACKSATPGCRELIDAALRTFQSNLDVALERLRAAYPQATIVLLTPYNPFSFGIADVVDFERLSDEALAELTAISAAVAGAHRVRIADGSRPMRGTVSITTHMIDDPVDIHPNELGYDILTTAVAAAFGV